MEFIKLNINKDNIDRIRDAIKNNHGLFYFVNLEESVSWLYMDNDYDPIDNIIGFSLGSEFAFYWNPGNAYKMNLKTQEIEKLSVNVSE